MRRDTWDVRRDTWDVRRETRYVESQMSDVRRGTRDMRRGTWNVGHETWDLRRETLDEIRGTWDARRGTWNVRRATWDSRRETRDAMKKWDVCVMPTGHDAGHVCMIRIDNRRFKATGKAKCVLTSEFPVITRHWCYFTEYATSDIFVGQDHKGTQRNVSVLIAFSCQCD